MPWPTNPSEQYFGRGLWGWVTDVWKRLTAEADGSLHTHITGHDGTLLIQQYMPSLLKPGIHGYDGSAWQELSLLWGYTDRLHVKATHTQVGAGAYTMTIATVPADYVYVVNAIISNNATRALKHSLQVCAAADCMTVYEKTTIAAGELVLYGNVTYVLKAGDSVKAVFTTSQNGDYMVGRVWGYMMKVS